MVVEETQDKEIQKTEEIQQMGEEQERPLVTPTSHVKTQDDSKIPEVLHQIYSTEVHSPLTDPYNDTFSYVNRT